ncbi:Oxidoreductase, short-chain dehydrogenase/reductase family [Rubellimicrobium mesophilum DSM 19309]|uniref:Oxidoreductase, short-chain dehydrogenase/reductase family n=1 Tax=Rubellimicrobium mesophilum DSM 19309 TaxID=442562 RepID=A0A017HU64_9RHOB|nr:SDR family oxidoreductase [Rubellimicrobium mesophilum]EYD77688.1 Oxidoreductase, short-chain dehydrogenase/reductase family [Rubellimicrobium mesophilum DSM 19309]
MPTALVTGASRGFGHALALALAPTHHVIAVARTVGGLEELDDRIQAQGGQATLAPMDITVPEAMRQLARSIYDRWNRLDLWVHTAIHAGPLAPAGHLMAKDLDKSIAINLRATADLIGVLSPLLGESGRAVFFDDPRGGEKFFGHYGSTKAAQIALAQSWQAEGERIGPRVLILQPRPMSTATRGRFFPGEDRAALATPTEEAQRLLPSILG